ncbi:phage major capsid protein [Thioalkalivibrio sp. ALJ15]|uniref:phage major capsid protein n=1 Tax=Thioalkalivibrio sp. ALJ15 TaxID=748652 RepID=UPI000378A18A|nr:phage major capsid protein [Thioalkalivibrio sp. ALJ15]
MKLKDLKEKRGQLVAEMRSLTDNPKGDGGDLSDEQSTQFDGLKTELERIEANMERARAVEDAERRMQGAPVSGTEERQWDQARRDYSLTRAMAGAAGLNVDDGREREVQQELARRSGRSFQGIAVPAEVFEERIESRDVLTSTGQGADLIATDHLGGQFIDRLREAVVVRRLGARVLRGLSGNVDIPKLAASATTGWVAENSALSESQHDFDKVSMAPKHAGAITELSRNMLQQASPDVEQLVRRDFAQILAASLDAVAIKGGGSNEPTGILETAGVSEVSSFAATWEKVQELIGMVEDEDATGTAFLTHPKVRRILRSTNKVDGEAEHGFIMDSRDSLDGYTVARTTLTPITEGDPDTAPLIFGNFSDLLIGFWSELDVLVNPFESTAYSKGNVKVRAMMTADVALRHPESFAFGMLEV